MKNKCLVLIFLIAYNCNNPISSTGSLDISGYYKKNNFVYSPYSSCDSLYSSIPYFETHELHIKPNDKLIFKSFTFDKSGAFSSGRFMPMQYKILSDHLLLTRDNSTFKINIKKDTLDLIYIAEDTLDIWDKEIEGRYIRIAPTDTLNFL